MGTVINVMGFTPFADRPVVMFSVQIADELKIITARPARLAARGWGLGINMWAVNDTYKEYGYVLSTAVSLQYMVKKPPQGYSTAKLKEIHDRLEEEEQVRLASLGSVSLEDDSITPAQDRPLTAAIITLSDKGARGERKDESGPAAKEMLEQAGYEVVETLLIPDEPALLKTQLIRLADGRQLDLVLTSGGTAGYGIPAVACTAAHSHGKALILCRTPQSRLSPTGMSHHSHSLFIDQRISFKIIHDPAGRPGPHGYGSPCV